MKSTIRQDRALVRLSLSNRRLTSSDLSKEWRQSAGVEVSTSTIRKKLLQSGLRGFMSGLRVVYEWFKGIYESKFLKT